MMKNRLSSRAVTTFILSVILFCMFTVIFFMNENYALNVRAENVSEEKTHTENETELGTVSGNEIPEPVCTCEDKCGVYEYDHNCRVCVEDYKLCAYKKPNVSISINKPDGWFNDTVSVTFLVADVAHTGNFEVAKIQAKVGQNGSWTDVTEDKKLEISENCTIYVQVTDQKGNTYERNRAIKCFDTTKPTLNAAVSDGLLSVQVHDTDSGVSTIYVNGYEFTELTNGTLNIRLQQFDAGYEYFTISAMDNAGNMSEVYKTKNPYYKDPADESDDNPAMQLPASVEATKPGSATGIVTEHTKTDSEGNTISENTLEEQKKRDLAKADAAETAEVGKPESVQSEQGKEFYVIHTESDKVFYLIIDRDGEEEMVYFLTEITENDLLNTTSDNSDILPKNSAALESAIPVSIGALPNNNREAEEEIEEESAEIDGEEDIEELKPESENESPVAAYIILGIAAVAAIGGGYYFKVVKGKKEEFLDEDDDDEEEYEDDAEENEDTEDSFFDNNDGEDK